ncbi:histidine kinase [Spongisporangium articulatum]|uniref:histidine kinase n=1 Tax=Spongisporangium articulatum TaxID=3362603 RepID=A0ABW8AJL2_9ACTN
MRTLIRRLDVTPLDAVLAMVFTLAGLVQVSLLPIAGGGLGHLYVLGATLPLAWRRTHPVEASVVASAFGVIPLDGYPVLGFVVVILLFYALGLHGRPLPAVFLATAWGCATGTVGTLLGPEPPVAVIGAFIAVIAPVLAGLVVRRLQAQNAELRRLTAELEAEREKVREAAVGAERERIAQELHDVLGHELTLIAIQAEGAAVALRGGRPGRAVAAWRWSARPVTVTPR